MIICKSCGRENEDEFKFCLGCGSALSRPAPAAAEPAQPQMVDCRHCGTPVPSNFKFCGACGGPIQTQAAAPAPRAASTPAVATPQAAAAASPAGSGGHAAAAVVEAPVVAATPAPAASKPAFAAEPVVETRPAARLTVIRPDGTEGAQISVPHGECVLGRSSQYEALSSDPFLSPRHARIVYADGDLRVFDEDSLNGIFIRLREEIELQDGDMLRIGQELLRFNTIDRVEPVPADVSDDTTRRGGSPSPDVWGRLSLVAGPDLVTRAFALQTDDVTIGREVGTILFRDDGFVSGKHARISRVNGKVYLRDLGSSNGTYVRIRKERRLEQGDLLLMGQQLFRLEV